MRPSPLVSLLAEAKAPSFFVPFLVFAALLAGTLGVRPWFGDEISALVMTRGSLGETLAAVAADVHPPLYFLLLKLVRAAAGERAWALRGLSAVFALAAFPFWWAIARRFFGRQVGLAAWLLATSSFVVFCSSFARYYSLGLLETGAATWLLLRLLEQPTRRLWIAYGVVVALLAYTFYLSVIVLAAHALVFVLAWRGEPRRLLSPLLVFGVVCLVFTPWAAVVAHQVVRVGAVAGGGGLKARALETAGQLAYTFYMFVASDSISPFALPLSAAVAGFYALVAGLGARRMWRNRTPRSLVIAAALALALAAPALMRLGGLLHEPALFLPVRLLPVAPFFLMLLACGVLAIGDPGLRAAVLATMLAIQAISLFNYGFHRQWTNWAYVVPMGEIVKHVEENAQPGDLVILDEWNLYRGPFYYWRGGPGVRVARFGQASPGPPAALDTAPRLWVLRAVRDQSAGRRMDQLLAYIKLNFVLKEQKGYVREPAVFYDAKRRWLRRDVYPFKVETLLFERPPK